MKAKLLLIPLIMLATACTEENGDLTEWMNEAQALAKANLKAPVPPEAVEPAQYNQPAPINPHAFHLYRMRPPAPKTAATGKAPNFNRPKELLEGMPLNQLKFVGTIGSGNVLSALVSLDGKQVYTVKVGNYLGQNHGRVVKITNDEITLSETVEDLDGNWVARQTILALGETPETDKK